MEAPERVSITMKLFVAKCGGDECNVIDGQTKVLPFKSYTKDFVTIKHDKHAYSKNFKVKCNPLHQKQCEEDDKCQ